MDSTEAAPWDLPDGAVCVVEFLPDGYRELHQGGDWYVWDGKRWSHTETGDWGEWVDEPRGVAVRSTTQLPKEQFKRIMTEAMEDREWPT